MPKIKITEIDNTGLISEETVSNTVYMPIKGATLKEPTLCSSLADVEDFFTAISATSVNEEGDENEEEEKDEISKPMAMHLVRLGMKVLLEGIGGEENTGPSWDALKDKSLYDIRFLTTGALGGYDKGAIECAASRGDCIALVDHEKTVNTAGGVRKFIDELSLIDDKKGVKKASGDGDDTDDEEEKGAGLVDEEGKDYGEFAAAFTPWISVRDKNDFTTVCVVPPSYGYLLAYARLIKNNQDGLAVAGSVRGIIPELVSVNVTYTTAEVEMLQARAKTGEVDLDKGGDNVGMAINPIVNVRPFGCIIWGNRTLKANEAIEERAEGNLKALSFLNIRQTVSTIKKKMYDAARKYTFEQNSEVLWTNFQDQITPTLDSFKTSNVLFGYKFTRIPTKKKARLCARLTIVPVEAVEDFDLEVMLADTLDVAE